MANNKNGKVGLPSHKLSFNPSTKGKNTTKPIEKFLYEACEERYGVDPDIDRSKAEENYFESQYGYRSATEVLEHCRKKMDAMSLAQGKKVRSDCIQLCNTILKPNIMLMDKFKTKAEQKEFLDNIVEEAEYQIGLKALTVEGVVPETIAREQAIKRGKELMVIACYHFDEANPHVHLFWEPIERRNGLEVFNAKKIHDKTLLSSLHRFIPKALIEKGYQLDKSFSFIEATQEEKDEYIQNKRLGNVQNGRDSVLYKVQQAKENDILIEQQQEILAQQDVQLSAIDEQREKLKAQEKAFEEKQREYLQQPVPQNHIKERKAGVFNKEEVVELPKTEYEETISQLRAVKLENETKDTIIKEKEEQIEQLTTQVEELTPFRAFVLGIIELFADKRIEPASRLDMVELSIKRTFPSLLQKAKAKLQKTVKRLPTFTPPHKDKNDDKSKNYDDVNR